MISGESRVRRQTTLILCETKPFIISAFIEMQGEINTLLNISCYEKCYQAMNRTDFKRYLSLCASLCTTVVQKASVFLEVPLGENLI